MRSIDFFPFGLRAVSITFSCASCSSDVEYDELEVPTPNFAAERSADSEAEEVDTVVCPECSREYTITVSTSFNGGYITIDDLNDDALLKSLRYRTGTLRNLTQ
jgi:Zn finger protein HypA/HybF involved in hydrogenase expression